jgi:M6 family metalloprotease-like protein
VAYGWYDLPEPQSAYVSGSSANLGKLKNDCAAAADADVFFPDFVGINFQFNLNIGGFSWGGGSNLVVDGQSRFYRMTWLADWADTFVYAHEMGHGFGLPHSSGPYGAVYDSRWDVMSGARNDHDPLWGWLAPHTISYHKDLLGWIPPDRLYVATQGSSETITLHRLADIGAGGDYLMARIPRGDGTY